MNYSKILFFAILFFFAHSIYSQSIQAPSLSHQKTTKTLIIDSIPVTKLNQIDISNISNMKFKNTYVVFFNSSESYPSFGFFNQNRQVIRTKNAFDHNSLFDPLTNNNYFMRSWDNPYGQDSFAGNILNGTLCLLFDLLPN
ncbi:hypothetical protein [Aquimarina sp. 2201CG14-23]|uniref:hypothetical protein n=1 Tax=Aquimarina mycalae TaxID=3040073 RepID=UPI002478214E|nr:hypothetical protein [Aquimarina sp. 2201CG14-23]MDH7447682.1 hypothetical protein [Aquimarina sp. 2201CG14-23]